MGVIYNIGFSIDYGCLNYFHKLQLCNVDRVILINTFFKSL